MTVNTKTNSIAKSLAEISDVSNPNLIDNPDFKLNISRGLDTYTSKGSTVTRWNLDYDSSIVVKTRGLGNDQQGGISLTFKNVGSTFYQKLDKKIIGKITISMKISKYGTGSLTPVLKVNGKINNYIDSAGIKIFKATGTEDDPISKIGIGALSKSASLTERSIDIDWIKLELGDNATSFVPPNYDEEYTRLLWYQRPIVNASRPAYVGGTGILYIPLPELATMRLSQPTVMYPNIGATLYCNGDMVTIDRSDVDLNNIFVDTYKELCIKFKDSNKLIKYKSMTCIIDFTNSQSNNLHNGFLLDAEIY